MSPPASKDPSRTIAVVNINDPNIKYQSAWLDTIQSHFEAVAHPDTEIVMKSPEPPALRRADETVVPYFMFLNNRNILEQVYEAAGDGADGVFIACSEDPVLLEARTLVDVPVAGAAEGTFQFAGTLGDRFGIVIPNSDQLGMLWRDLLKKNELTDRCVDVVPMDQPFIETFTQGWEDPNNVTDVVRDAARTCVDGGADSVILGSGGLSTMATAADFTTLDEEVPLLDVLSVGFAMLETKITLVDTLGIPPVSRAHGRERVDGEDLDRVRSLFELD